MKTTRSVAAFAILLLGTHALAAAAELQPARLISGRDFALVQRAVNAIAKAYAAFDPQKYEITVAETRDSYTVAFEPYSWKETGRIGTSDDAAAEVTIQKSTMTVQKWFWYVMEGR